MSDNLALQKVVQEWKFCFLPEKSFVTETGRSEGHVQKGLQGCLYLKYYVISRPLVSYAINFWGIMTPKKKEEEEEDPNDSELAAKEIYRWNSALLVVHPKYTSSNK